MKKISIIYFVAFLTINLSYAQNLFPTKLENCRTEKFCLDCGDEKASYQIDKFEKLQDRLNKSLNLKGIKGFLKLQVLVDSKGKGCVLSHTDK